MVAGPKELVFVDDADHFFEGHLAAMQQAIHHWVQEFFKPARQAEAS
jgi:alpha/beta superfamily hydrolase